MNLGVDCSQGLHLVLLMGVGMVVVLVVTCCHQTRLLMAPAGWSWVMQLPQKLEITLMLLLVVMVVHWYLIDVKCSCMQMMWCCLQRQLPIYSPS
jgi:hypothetical protein